MKKRPPLHLSVVAIEKGAFGLPSTKVAKFIFCIRWKYLKPYDYGQIICVRNSFLEL